VWLFGMLEEISKISGTCTSNLARMLKSVTCAQNRSLSTKSALSGQTFNIQFFEGSFSAYLSCSKHMTTGMPGAKSRLRISDLTD
jgi:hypothetical protein